MAVYSFPLIVLLCFASLSSWRLVDHCHGRKKHPKKICIKNFGGTLAGGSRRGLRRPDSLCRCWFSQQNTVHKEFRGGGSKGVLGVGSKVQFWGPISLCLCAFLGLDIVATALREVLTEDIDFCVRSILKHQLKFAFLPESRCYWKWASS